MAIDILMPALSPTMEAGKLAKWLVNEGDTVSSGDIIAEIETDKATMEVEAVDEGTVGALFVAAGSDDVPVNAVIAVLLEEGESADDVKFPEEREGGGPAKAETAETDKQPAPEDGSSETEQARDGSDKDAEADKTAAKEKPVPEPAGDEPSGERLRASPLARRLARDRGLELAQLKGSGPRGRIVKADVLSAEDQPKATAAAGKGSAPVAAGSVDAKKIADGFGLAYEAQPVSRMRQTIARRLTESKQTVPHFYLNVDINLDALLATRRQINTHQEAVSGPKISVNDFIIKASARALMQVPAANASWNGNEIISYENAHVSVAVAIDDGLITPVVRLAEDKSLSDISAEVKDLATRARDGKLKPDEFQGGTFSISNLGMFGVRDFAAVINPPESMILAVGQGEKRPVIKEDGSVGVATMMTVTLSCDHRVVDGALGAQWLQAFKALMENPVTMLV